MTDLFQCWYCEKNLKNIRYVIKDNFAICLNCFEEKYSNYCFQCNRIIGIEMQVRLYISRKYELYLFY